MNLTEEERRKFSLYCAEEAKSATGLAEQAAKLPGAGLADIMVKRLKTEAAAFAIVARKLDNTETITL